MKAEHALIVGSGFTGKTVLMDRLKDIGHEVVVVDKKDFMEPEPFVITNPYSRPIDLNPIEKEPDKEHSGAHNYRKVTAKYENGVVSQVWKCRCGKMI